MPGKFIQTAYPNTVEEFMETLAAQRRGEVGEIASTFLLIEDVCRRLLALEGRSPSGE